MKSQGSTFHYLMAPFVALACVAYIFRFPTPFGAISLFRIATLIYILFGSGRFLLKANLATSRNFDKLGAACILFVLPTAIDVALISDAQLLPAIYSYWINLAFFLAFSLVVDRKYFELYLKWYCFVAVAESAVALYGYFGATFVLEFLIRDYGSDYVKNLNPININDGLTRLTGTFYDPNFYGLYLVSVIGSAIWLYLYENRNSFYLVLVIGCASQLLLTGSRTSLLALAGILLAYWTYKGVSIRGGVLICLMMCAAFFGIMWWSPDLLDHWLNGESVADRFSFFDRGISAFLSNPLLGGGSDSLVDPETGISTAHSFYLSLLGRNGIFGVISFVCAIYIILRPVLLKKMDCSSKHFVVQMFLMVAISFFSYDTLYFFEPLYFLFAMMFVCISARGNGSKFVVPSSGAGRLKSNSTPCS